MRHQRVFRVIFALCMCGSARLHAAEVPYAGGPPQSPPGMSWERIAALSDEFEGGSLDPNKWIDYHPYWKGRNSEFVPENVSVADGCLQLTSTLRDRAEAVNAGSVTAACMSSKERNVGYGYYESCVKASDLSMTIAFWFQGKGLEMDVIENIGTPSKTEGQLLVPWQMRMNSHCSPQDPNEGKSMPVNWIMPALAKSCFHVFGMLWNEDVIRYYYQGKPVYERANDGRFDGKTYLFFDTEVFDWHGWPTRASLLDETKNTSHVDWVRSWRLVKANTDPGTLAAGYPQTERARQCINVGWQYHLGDLPGTQDTAYDDSDWDTISVPHTLKLTSLALDHNTDDKTQPTFHRAIAWYRRSIDVSENPGKVFLEFEGAHQVTDLWVNGRHVGQHAIGGYTPFHFDITEQVHPGENCVALRLDNRRRDDTPPDPGPFDYVKFSGLYRDVYLVETAALHVTFPWEAFYAGVFVTTPTVDILNQNATVAVRTTVRNEHAQTRAGRILTRVIDREGVVVLRMQDQAQILPGAEFTFNQCSGIEEDLHVWSCDDPYLYRVNTLIYDGDRAVDCVENPLGIRSIELNKHDGFLLNGEPIKMIGANRHQHYPYIGDAVPNALHVKDIWQFKQMGFNIIRTAHYPHDNALLDACDRLGVLVYEEPPTWISIGSDTWFDNLERAARRMVRNHRNHPSVVIWGAGINHRGSVPRLHYAVKQEDPTRWTGSNNSEWTGVQNSGVCDLFTNMDYDGIKDWSGEEYLFAMEGGGSQQAVSKTKSNPLRLGLTSWTAHAYYTFHLGPERDNRMRSGMMDGFRTPSVNARWYGPEMKSQPLVIIGDPWKPGIKTLHVFSNCDEVEVRVNDVLLARQVPVHTPQYAHLSSPPFEFEIDHFQAGELVALGLIKGDVKAIDRVRTPGKPVALHLELDMEGRQFTADGADIVMAYARVVDKNGTFIEESKTPVRFTVDGPASIVGDTIFPEANPMSPTRHGSAPVMVRAGTEPGLIVVRAEASGLQSAEARVTSVPFNDNMIAAGALPIYDLEKVQVDLGKQGQLVQFGWTPWNGTDNETAVLDLPELGGFSVTLRTGSSDGVTRWLGEMNVKGFHGFVMGEGVCVIDPQGLVLEFRGLPAGHYRLKTYHHAPKSNTNSMDPNRERLKTLRIHEIPIANPLAVQVAGMSRVVAVTSGTQLPDQGPGTAMVNFVVQGDSPVTVRMTDTQGVRGIWLNGFELQASR